jgi:peptide/nickel transport system permease protein
MIKYLARRIVGIILTIVLGVYITVWLANKTGAVDESVINQIDEQIRWMEYHDYFADVPEEQLDSVKYSTRLRLRKDVGLMEPSAQRNFRWTINALSFNWGKTVHWVTEVSPGSTRQELFEVQDIILLYFPNTLMVIGVANLIILATGIPLALTIASRKRGKLTDRIVSLFSPISSIPSWVHGALLITVFAVQLKVLPASGKYDVLPAENWVENAMIVGKHMILPVSAVILGVFFQLVYSWRTYLMIYTEEDYVELAKSQGITQGSLERNHILRPALPFLLTSFGLTLVGFWQMTTALEKFFYWPGIGQLYLNSLPQYFQEEFFPGNLSVLLSVVVIFAYILGFTVLVLDITYIAVDPRVRVNSDGQINTSTTPKFAWLRYIKRDRSRKHPGAKKVTFSSVLFAMRNIRVKLCGIKAGLQRTMCEILHYPSAITGLVLISFLIIGSLYAVIAYPYFELGEEWHRTSLTGRFYIPKNVPAEWINLFRKKDYPTTILLRSRDGGLTKTTNHLKNGKKEILFSAPISYPFGDFPQDIILYIDTDYQEKAPHISISWITPDGREIHPKSPAIKSSSTYFFSEYIVLRSFLRNNKNWEKWFVTKGPKPTPPIYALFASPEADEPTAIPGTYQLKISALTFEDDTNVSIEFVLLGQVYGKAGTDYMRRDLLIPLLWGLPFALVLFDRCSGDYLVCNDLSRYRSLARGWR